VLWAGRLDTDKRPDLLRAIAERLPALRFHVYGTPVLHDDSELRRLRAVPNIDYRGPFSGFDSIATAPYHCFLYTSRCDGQPNVLLEAMQSGLLVVASDVGAVAEVVGDETGVLVRPADEPAAYAEAIGRTLRDGQTWRRVAANGQRHVAANFTTAAFRETLRTLPGYLS
jgi:glycosyltransferase involved in cell wall biosynthesis